MRLTKSRLPTKQTRWSGGSRVTQADALEIYRKANSDNPLMLELVTADFPTREHRDEKRTTSKI